MICPPPISTRTDTLFPYSTLFGCAPRAPAASKGYSGKLSPAGSACSGRRLSGIVLAEGVLVLQAVALAVEGVLLEIYPRQHGAENARGSAPQRLEGAGRGSTAGPPPTDRKDHVVRQPGQHPAVVDAQPRPPGDHPTVPPLA